MVGPVPSDRDLDQANYSRRSLLSAMDRSTAYYRLSLIWLALLLVTSVALVVLLQ